MRRSPRLAMAALAAAVFAVATITLTGTKNAAFMGTRVDLDALLVLR